MERLLSRRGVAVLFAAAALVTLGLGAAHFVLLGFGVTGDGLGYYAPLRSAILDHDLVVSNEYEVFAETVSRFGGGSRWPHPLPLFSKYTVGMGVVLAPFFLVAHLVMVCLNGLQRTAIAADGLTWPYELSYCLGSLLAGLTGLVFVYRSCRLFSGRLPALLAVLGVWFASPLFYYLAFENSMSHAVSQGLVSAFVFFWLESAWRTRTRRAILMGVLLGLAVLVRPQNVLFAVLPLASLATGWRTPERNRLMGRVAWVGGVAVLCACTQFGVYALQYGTVMGSPYMIEGDVGASGSSFHWLRPAIMSALFSGHRGLFVWHPLTLVGTLGLCGLCRRDRACAVPLILALLLQVYLVAAWHCWWQGAALGSRMLSNSTVIFAIGLAWVWEQARGWKVAAACAATTVMVGWNALLVMQYMTGMVDPEAPVTVRQLWGNQFGAIPHFVRHMQGKGTL